MPLSADRDTQRIDGDVLDLPVAAGEKIYAGALVATNATGYAVAGAASTTIKGAGRADEQVDNTNGQDGDLTVRVRKGVFCFANSGTDPVTIADRENNVYIEDDETVAKTSNTNTLSVAGKLIDVTERGVWVKFD